MSDYRKGSSVPAKIMAGLAMCVLLGLGLCGVGAVGGNKAQEYFFIAGSICFFGGLALLILFGVGWAIYALCKKLFRKKD